MPTAKDSIDQPEVLEDLNELNKRIAAEAAAATTAEAMNPPDQPAAKS